MASQINHVVAAQSTPLLSTKLGDLRDTVTSVSDKLEVVEDRLTKHIVNTVMDPSTNAADAARERAAKSQRYNRLYHEMELDPEYRRLFEQTHQYRHLVPDRRRRDQVDRLLSDVSHLAAERAREDYRKEIRELLEGTNIVAGVGVCKDLIQSLVEKVQDTQSAWQGLQGVDTSGRVEFAVRRDAAVRDYDKSMARLAVLFGQKTTYERAMDSLSDDANKMMLQAGFDAKNIPSEDLEDAEKRRRMVLSSMKTLEGQIHPGRGSQQFEKMQSLTLPPNLETSLRGQELTTLFDAYMHQNGAHYPVAAVVAKRVSKDVDPIAGTFWKPPCATDGYAGMSSMLVSEFKKEAARIETDFLKMLSPATVQELQRSFNYGVGQDQVARADVGDGVSLYWALLSKYRPLDEMYRQDIEKFLYGVHMRFDRYDSSLVKTLTEIGKYCAEAKTLGIRVKWFLTGAQWVRKLSSRSTYAVKLQRFQTCSCDSDDCIYLLEELVREIKLVAVDEFSQPDTTNPYSHDHLSLYAGASDPPQDFAVSFSAEEHVDHEAMAMGNWQPQSKGKGKGDYGKGGYGKGGYGRGSYGKGMDDGSVVPGRRMMISQGSYSMRGTPPPMSRRSSYGHSGSPGGGGLAARSFQYAHQRTHADRAMSAAVLPPKNWDKERGCFNDGCVDKRFKTFDLCTTCHRAGLETGSFVGKDKKSYKIMDFKKASPEDRLAANKAIAEGASIYRKMVGEVGMSAEQLDPDYLAMGYDEALQESYESGMMADVDRGQKRQRSDSDPDVHAAAAMSAKACRCPESDDDEDADSLTNGALVRAMRHASAELRKQDPLRRR